MKFMVQCKVKYGQAPPPPPIIFPMAAPAMSGLRMLFKQDMSSPSKNVNVSTTAWPFIDLSPFPHHDTTRDVRFGPKMGQIGPNGTIRDFLKIFQYILIRYPHIWSEKVPNSSRLWPIWPLLGRIWKLAHTMSVLVYLHAKYRLHTTC